MNVRETPKGDGSGRRRAVRRDVDCGRGGHRGGGRARFVATVVALGAALALVARPAAGQATEPDAPLTLSAAVELALAAHPSIAAATARRDEATESLGEALASRGPLVRATVSALHYDEPMVVSPIHGFGIGLFPPFDDTLVQGSLNVSYLLFDAGARRHRGAQVGAQVAAIDAALDATGQALAARVVQAYAGVLANRETLAAEVARLAALDGERDRVARLIEAGKAPEVDALRAGAARAAVEAARLRAAARLTLAEQDLARLLGTIAQPSGSAPPVLAPLAEPTPPLEPRETLAERARAASPQVEQARRQVEAAVAARAVARTAYFPELRAVGAVQEFADGDLEATTDWHAGFQLTVPLWDGGLTNRRVARASAQLDLARATLAQAELDAAEAVDRALAAWAEASARAAALAEAEERWVEVARVQALLLDVGSGTQVDYLAALAELATTRAERSQARAAAVVARVDLARATGELSRARDWIRQTLEASR